MFILLIFVSVCLFWRGFFDERVAELKDYRSSTPDIILPMRGKILDRNGKILAESKEAFNLQCNRNQMENPELFMNQIGPIVNIDEQTLMDDYKKNTQDPKTVCVVVARKLTENQVERIKKLVKDSPICNYEFVPDQKRTYPKRTTAASLVGFVGLDNTGLSGIEHAYNNLLSGIPGNKIYNRTFSGNKVPGSEEILHMPNHGKNLVLTLDEKIQSKVESILELHVEKSNAKGGVAIVVNPRNGELIAMASYPTFDLNMGQDYIGNVQYSNKALAMNYEPGSVFKSVTASAALDLGFITPEDAYTCEGQIWVENKPIQCIIPHGTQKLADYIRNSCNVVFAQIGQKMGVHLLDFVERFYFGSHLPIQLSEQEAGILPDRDWYSDLEAANISFGTSISVTPLQMIYAYAAIINGGDYLKPLLIKEIQDSTGKVIEKFEKQILKKVISQETSAEMVTVLQNVVQDPNGCTQAKIPGVPIGGKTGTSYKSIDGQYQNDKVVCSFVGFFPTDAPEYLILVSIDEPYPSYNAYGSTIAAPVFKDIAQWILRIEDQSNAFE
ncbi:MAG: penicillin-binding protein 2 [Caldisericia bacterium]|nr:penicillin-binding protein 2 [Caldisericia bacterium]MDD4613936.1 penicillin-binding protein 2 [Caldisericia bacterium]